MDEEKLKSIRDEYLTRSDKVDYSLDLPEAETDVMLALWRGEGPYNTSKVMKLIGEHKGWKPSTLISFLSRLEEKGFIMSYKDGKERFYIPLAEKEIYVKRLTEKLNSASAQAFLPILKIFQRRSIRPFRAPWKRTAAATDIFCTARASTATTKTCVCRSAKSATALRFT